MVPMSGISPRTGVVVAPASRILPRAGMVPISRTSPGTGIVPASWSLPAP